LQARSELHPALPAGNTQNKQGSIVPFRTLLFSDRWNDKFILHYITISCQYRIYTFWHTLCVFRRNYVSQFKMLSYYAR